MNRSTVMLELANRINEAKGEERFNLIFQALRRINDQDLISLEIQAAEWKSKDFKIA